MRSTPHTPLIVMIVDGQQRPVITFHLPIGADGKPETPQITRDIMVAKAITPHEVEKLTVTKSDGGYFHECKLAAVGLPHRHMQTRLPRKRRIKMMAKSVRWFLLTAMEIPKQ
jgi:hypothetical protein